MGPAVSLEAQGQVQRAAQKLCGRRRSEAASMARERLYLGLSENKVFLSCEFGFLVFLSFIV